MEQDILALTRQWEAHRTIRSGDTPGSAMGRGPRPALAPIPLNCASEAANPFSFTAQRHKAAAAAGGRRCSQGHHLPPLQQQQQQHALVAGRSAGASHADAPPRSGGRADSEAGGGPGPAAAAAATPTAGTQLDTLGRTLGGMAAGSAARAFDRGHAAAAASAHTMAATGAGLKRKLLISPGADISGAFPTLCKPTAKLQRAISDAPAAAAAARSRMDGGEGDLPPAAGAAGEADEQSLLLHHYWSDPLPMLAGALQQAIPTVDQPDCGFPSITHRTLHDLLIHGAAAFGLSSCIVVDCRYDYEHQGGRLPGSLHLTTPEELQGLLAAHPPQHDWQRTALVFHCEFSTERGPRAAKFVRNRDREAHMHDYPALSYPHVFVLQGGYKAFWRAYPELCLGGYTPMDHPDFGHQLKACHNAVKRAWAKTTRTYARGQRQRRPSYRLRQSFGAAAGGSRPPADGNTA